MNEQQAGSEVLTSRSSCSIHSRRSVVSASAMSHEWCEILLKIDRATAVTMSRRGARGHTRKRTDGTYQRGNATPCTTHHYTPTSTARAGALMFHHPAWVEHHTGGSRSTRLNHDHAHATQVTDTSCEHGWRPNSLVAK